jgi:hypothetical protein
VVFRISDDWMMILVNKKRKGINLYHVMAYITEILKHISGNCGQTHILKEVAVIYVINSNNFW